MMAYINWVRYKLLFLKRTHSYLADNFFKHFYLSLSINQNSNYIVVVKSFDFVYYVPLYAYNRFMIYNDFGRSRVYGV